MTLLPTQPLGSQSAIPAEEPFLSIWKPIADLLASADLIGWVICPSFLGALYVPSQRA